MPAGRLAPATQPDKETAMTALPSTEGSGGVAWWRCAAQMTPTDVRNMRRFNAWTFVWAAAFVAASFILKAGLVPAGAAAIAVALFPTLLGLMMIRAYLRFIRRADELVRKVQLEGAALGFGVGVLFAVGYGLLERAGAPKLDVSDSIMPMVLAWAIGQVLAWKRYS